MKKQFLFILPFYPWPLLSGGHQGIFNSICAVKDYADIHLVYYAGQKDVNECYHQELKSRIGGNVEIHPYVDKPGKWTKDVAFRKIGNKIFKRVDHLSYLLFTKLHDNAYYEYVNSLISRYGIDLVQVEMVEVLDFVLTLPPEVKRVFVHHELRFVRNEKFLERGGDDYYHRALAKVEKMKEIGLLNAYDLILTVSEIDKEKLIQAGVIAPIHASFSIVNTNVTERQAVSSGSKRLTYVGPEAHYPNKVGLEWFLEKVWPIILQKDPGFRLEIIGRWTSKTIAAWTKQYKNVNFLGFVDDLSSVLQNSTMIVPIFVGSGIRMKILEAMSYGIPFVSTSVGAEGIPVQSGVHGFVTDDAVAFADAVLETEDLEVRKRLVENSFALVQKNYSAEALARNKKAAYESLLGTL